MRVKPHFLWLSKDGVRHCQKITQKDVDGYLVEHGASDLAKAKKRGDKQAISKRKYEVPLIVEKAHKSLNNGPLEKMKDIVGRDEVNNMVAKAIFASGIPSNVVQSTY